MKLLFYSPCLSFLIPFYSILIFMNPNSASAQCSADQMSLLLQIKTDLVYNAGLSSKLVKWNQSLDFCSWPGVKCLNRCVTDLDLSSEYISDGLTNFNSIFDLKHLQKLNLAYNEFNSTTIPSRFGDLTSLTYLNLSNAGFAGQIPIEISHLTQLVTLDFSTFFFIGTPLLRLENPNLGGLVQNLTRLSELYLDGVDLSSSGTTWGKVLSSSLPNLTVLSIPDCKLLGSADDFSLARLRVLSLLRLDRNNLSALDPQVFAKFSHLVTFSAVSCELKGDCPAEVFQVLALQTLDLSDNPDLHGTLPPFFGNNSLQILILSNTGFTGTIPESIGELKRLSHLDLELCNFHGPIPGQLWKLNNLVHIDLSSNRLNGSLQLFAPLVKLTVLLVPNNLLTGSITTINWKELVQLENLDARNNSLSGKIPASLFGMKSLKKLELSHNRFDSLENVETDVTPSVLDTLDQSGGGDERSPRAARGSRVNTQALKMASSGQCRPPEISKVHPRGATSLTSDDIFPPLNSAAVPTNSGGTNSGDGAARSIATVMGDGAAIPPVAGGAWASAARSLATVIKAQKACIFPTIQLASRQYGQKEGKPTISFTASELQVGINHLKHALVAKFSGGRPPINEVRQSFLALWSLTGHCSIGALDAKNILIVLDSEMDACKVLSHPTRKLGHSLFRIFRWSKEFNTKREPSITTSWVRLASLPPELYNPGYIKVIASAFGRFLAVDNRTRSFTNPNYARVCLEIDTTKDMPEEVWIATGTDSGFWQKVVYESRLQFCTKCRLHGHDIHNCRKNKMRQEAEQRIWEARDEHGLPHIISNVSAPQATQKEDKSLSLSIQTQPDKGKEKGWQLVQKRKGYKTTFLQKDHQHLSLQTQSQSVAKAVGNCEAQKQTSPTPPEKGLRLDNKERNEAGLSHIQTKQATDISQEKDISKNGPEEEPFDHSETCADTIHKSPSLSPTPPQKEASSQHQQEKDNNTPINASYLNMGPMLPTTEDAPMDGINIFTDEVCIPSILNDQGHDMVTTKEDNQAGNSPTLHRIVSLEGTADCLSRVNKRRVKKKKKKKKHGAKQPAGLNDNSAVHAFASQDGVACLEKETCLNSPDSPLSTPVNTSHGAQSIAALDATTKVLKCDSQKEKALKRKTLSISHPDNTSSEEVDMVTMLHSVPTNMRNHRPRKISFNETVSVHVIRASARSCPKEKDPNYVWS